ncbi:MAG: hypothetical protein V1712_01535 [Patescibacteria group bacterium]
MNIFIGLIYGLTASIILILFFYFRHGNKSFAGIITGSVLAAIVGLTPSDDAIISITLSLYEAFTGYLLGRFIQTAVEINKSKKIEG